jgi:hypothetical protein
LFISGITAAVVVLGGDQSVAAVVVRHDEERHLIFQNREGHFMTDTNIEQATKIVAELEDKPITSSKAGGLIGNRQRRF